MSLREKIKKDMVSAAKAGDKLKLSTLRMLSSSITYKEKEGKGELGDEEVQSVVMTLVKQRKDSAEQYRKGGREDLAEKEEKETGILKEYLPEQLSEEKLREIVKSKVSETGASSIKDMGTLMKAVMAEVKGRADGKTVNRIVREELGG